MTWCDHKLEKNVDTCDLDAYYGDGRGSVFFVHEYDLGASICWATFKDIGPSRKPHRVNSIDLPWRNTKEAAESDLRAYAAKRGLKEYSK